MKTTRISNYLVLNRKEMKVHVITNHSFVHLTYKVIVIEIPTKIRKCDEKIKRVL